MASHESVQVNGSCLALLDELFCSFGRNLIVSLNPWLKPICIMWPRGRIASHSGRRSIRLHHNRSCTRVPGLGRAGPFLEWRHVSALAVGGSPAPDPTRLIRLRGSYGFDLWPPSSFLHHGAFGHHTLSGKAPERQSATRNLRAMATIAIRQGRPHSGPTRSRNQRLWAGAGW
jgi:hypothetical protein